MFRTPAAYGPVFFACGKKFGHKFTQKTTKGFAKQMNACGIKATDHTDRHGFLFS